MGNQPTTPANVQQFINSNKLEKIAQLTDDRLGETTFYRNANNADSLYLVRDRYSVSDEEFKNITQKIKTRDSLQQSSNAQENIQKIYLHAESNESEWCSQYYKHTFIAEYHEDSLEKSLAQKKRLPKEDDETKYLNEPEAWYILEALVSQSKQLIAQNLIHGDIQPKNVMISPEGKIKLLDVSLLSSRRHGYKRVLHDQNYYAALAPEQLTQLKNRDTNDKSDQRSEIFAIGLTTLSSIVNDPIAKFYDWKNYKVNYNAVNNKYEKLKNKGYSPQLIDTIKRCLEENPNNRVTHQTIEDELRRGDQLNSNSPQQQRQFHSDAPDNNTQFQTITTTTQQVYYQ